MRNGRWERGKGDRWKVGVRQRRIREGGMEEKARIERWEGGKGEKWKIGGRQRREMGGWKEAKAEGMNERGEGGKRKRG